MLLCQTVKSMKRGKGLSPRSNLSKFHASYAHKGELQWVFPPKCIQLIVNNEEKNIINKRYTNIVLISIFKIVYPYLI